jgi:hypothetical protein
MIGDMVWRILVALLLTLPPVAYVAGALSGEVEDRTPRPTVVLPTGDAERSPGVRDRNGGERQGQRPRDTGGADNDDRPGGVTVVRPDPVTVGENGGDDDHDHDDGDDDDTDDVDDD